MNDDRIYINPSPVSRGGSIEIGYRGLLKNSGADAVWMHYGFDGWKNPMTVPMTRKPDGSFSTSIIANGSSEINFCFKDSADHWDNNSGWNWKADIR